MQVVRIIAAIAAAVAAAAGCGDSLDQEQLQSARRTRTVLPLTRVAADRFIDDDDVRETARALIDKHYDYAIRTLPPERAFERALLAQLRAARDPRVFMSVSEAQPDHPRDAELARLLPAPADRAFAEGATQAAQAAFPHGVVVFETDPEDLTARGSGPWFGDHTPTVEVTWKVSWSERMFERPMLTFGAVDRSPLPSIVVTAQLEFSLPGHPEPWRFDVRGEPGPRVEYRTSGVLGMASESDLYRGLLAAAVADALSSVFAPAAPEGPP